ncbi:hypothetical protein GC170_18025 [bacterium]|nr:hypothetical protein [bacterium]
MNRFFKPIAASKASHWLIAAVFLTLASGCACGGSRVSDPAQAEEILSTALEAWKSGTSSEDLASGNPAIVVYDPDWKAGTSLVTFEPQPARLAGNNVTLPVRLTLKTGKGRKVQRTAVYAITTNPVNMIVREEG